jgi:hypothetical protein
MIYLDVFAIIYPCLYLSTAGVHKDARFYKEPCDISDIRTEQHTKDIYE